MITEEKEKRLFFGIDVSAPWPHEYPQGRLLEESYRHITVAFLGNVSYEKLVKILPEIPTIPIKVGLAARLDACLFLPPRKPRVVAWHVNWIDDSSTLLAFQQQLVKWLQEHGFQIKNSDREFLPHVTLCRAPFVIKQWKHTFSPVPCVLKNLHLYESLGNMKYQSLWNIPLQLPFEEIEHTADIAFNIYGENLQQLHNHAQVALAFRFPALLPYFSELKEINSLAEIISDLNKVIAKADGEIGCPFKAVSFHGEIQKDQNQILFWEMIVDV